MTESQPIAITDVLYWLFQGLEVPETSGKTLEKGGPDVLLYRELMSIMAEELHFRRRIIIPLAVMESFFGTQKTELIYHDSYASRKEARQALFEYIEGFYNTNRFHSTLGYLSPLQFENLLN